MDRSGSSQNARKPDATSLNISGIDISHKVDAADQAASKAAAGYYHGRSRSNVSGIENCDTEKVSAIRNIQDAGAGPQERRDRYLPALHETDADLKDPRGIRRKTVPRDNDLQMRATDKIEVAPAIE